MAKDGTINGIPAAEYHRAWKQKNKAKISAKWKIRYANDPELRARMSARSKLRYHTDAAYKKRQLARLRPKPPQHVRRSQCLKQHYGITLDDKYAIMASQGGRCPGCTTAFADLPQKKAHVDHCHRTDKIRGVLCHQCNVALGLVRDDPATLRRLAGYIEAAREAVA